ncbi:hypothetical protein D3C87_1985390 [compost metagenome]
MIDETFDTGNGVFTRISVQLFISQQNDARLHDIVAGRKTGHRLTEPTHRTIRAKRQIIITAGMQTGSTRLIF